MKKLFLSTLLLALPLLASAYDAEVDGIYYNLIPKGNVAEVTYQKYDRSNYPYYVSDYSGSVTIPEKFTYESVEYSVTVIGDYAFNGCSGLTSVTIPNSVTSIGGSAFYGCSGLTSVTIPNSVTSIGNEAFWGCSGLTSVAIPNSVTSIGWYAFSGCSDLTSIKVESGNSIYDSRGNCNAIIESSTNILIAGCEKTVIPNSVTSIGNEAFRGCTGLGSVTIPGSVTIIGRAAFYGCSGLTSVTIPNSVTSIENNAFDGCTGLTSMNIPNSVTSIGGSAFSGCSGLTSVTIPNSVKSMGDKYSSGVFRYCDNLVSVVSKMEYPCSVSIECFSDAAFKNATLYIPKGTMDRYKMKDFWNKFENIVEGEPGSSVIPGTPQCATPTISYSNNELTFSCATEGVEYKYTIADSDVKTDYASKVPLSATYEISVYAMKEGLGNSDVATATLVWTDAIFTVTTPETPTSAKAMAESIPVLISANGGAVSVKSEQDGQPVAVYSADGKMLGAATIKDGQAAISTNLQRGEIVIVKVGGRSVKVKTSDF